jgi:hypothetical protein
MKTLALALVLICSQGCAALASREAAAGCQVADLATSERAFRLNPNAVEENPIPFPVLVVVKLALAWFIMTWDQWDEAPQGARIALTVIGCAPVPGNLRAARQ